MVQPPSYGITCSPCLGSSSVRMISGRSRLHTYEQFEYVKSLYKRRLTAAPPMKGLRSSTWTLSPALASRHAVTKPLWPAPTTIASSFSLVATFGRRSGQHFVTGAARLERGVDGDLERLQRVGETGGIVRGRDEPGLPRVRLAQHAFVVQYLRHRIVEGIIAAFPGAVVARRLMREVQAAHRGMADEAVGDSTGRENRAHAGAQLGAVVGDALERVGLVEDLQRPLGCGQRHRVGRVGSAVGHAAPDLAHDVLAPGEHRNGIAVADGLR